MTLPDVRRLLQVIFAPEAPTEQQAIALSDWRQRRNHIASVSHAKARKQRLRQTG